MAHGYRLKSDDMFERREEEQQEEPKRFVFLSMEGNKTEINYFNHINRYKREIGIKKEVCIYPLKRSKNDTLSAPRDVLELLEECVELQNKKILPSLLQEKIEKYSDEFVKKYLNGELTEKGEVEEFESLLKQAGIDLAYQRFLAEYSREKDIFGIVIDRDYKSHTVKQMMEIVQECSQKNYYCFITNPSFEFWLLLHLKDISSFSSEEKKKILLNNKVSDKHTYTSGMVSQIANHSKKISKEKFKQFYLPKITYAIEQAKKNCATLQEDLIGNEESQEASMGQIGTNIPELFDLLFT